MKRTAFTRSAMPNSAESKPT